MSRNSKDKDDNNKTSHGHQTPTIMPQEESASGKKSFWPKLEITGNVRNISPAVWQLQHLTSLNLKGNNLSRIPADISRLQHLNHLDLSCNKLRSLPAEIGDLTRLRELLLNNNQLRVLPYELGKLFNLQKMGLLGNPLSLEIQSIYAESNGTQKLLSYMLNSLAEDGPWRCGVPIGHYQVVVKSAGGRQVGDLPLLTAFLRAAQNASELDGVLVAPRPVSPRQNVRTPTPGDREWVPLSQLTLNRPACAFTVMCYNVLCDKYATRQMYGYCPPWALEWTYRKKGIMDEIRRYAADIITLQEVETDQFFNYFLPELKKDGYEGIFSPKSRAKHMSESERKYVDGCAIFWRTRKFTLAKEHLIEFNQLAMANHDGSEDMLNRVMTKDNIGLAALLHTTEVAWGDNLPEKSQVCQPILVCTAHIHWDPEFCDVKLIQTIMLMSEVRGIVNQIIEDSRGRGGTKLDFHDIHLMLCGDLNSLPDSGVIEFLTKGSVSMDHTDFKGLGYKTPLQKIALSKSNNAGLVNTAANIYTHSFRLAGTYDFNIMPYTNYTYEFKGIIDYIFHSRNGIRTLGVLGPIDPEWFTTNKVVGCPHPHIPSDHFPLLVELELQPANSSHPNGLLHR